MFTRVYTRVYGLAMPLKHTRGPGVGLDPQTHDLLTFLTILPQKGSFLLKLPMGGVRPWAFTTSGVPFHCI
jgi:hypothetical protein